MLTPVDIRPGDELYVYTSWYIDRGDQDVCGGIAVVSQIHYEPVPQNPYNDYFVTFQGIPNARNLQYILDNQVKWEAEYGLRMAHHCPDLPGRMCPRTTRAYGIIKKGTSKVDTLEKT